MNPDDIYNVIEQAVEKTVPPTVERVVNGKIRALQETLNEHVELSREHRERLEQQLKELQPISDGLRFFNYGRKFVAWFTPLIPLILFCGGVYVAIRKIIE